MRGLFYEFPHDNNVTDISDEYMFGSDILVAPVVECGSRQRNVYLPGDEATVWTNLRDGAEYSGGHYIHVASPLDSISVFAKNHHYHELLGNASQ